MGDPGRAEKTGITPGRLPDGCGTGDMSGSGDGTGRPVLAGCADAGPAAGDACRRLEAESRRKGAPGRLHIGITDWQAGRLHGMQKEAAKMHLGCPAVQPETEEILFMETTVRNAMRPAMSRTGPYHEMRGRARTSVFPAARLSGLHGARSVQAKIRDSGRRQA